MEKLSNPQRTIEVIKKYEFCFQKKFGQNFLIDGHVLDKIIAGAGVTKDDMVLEIGPGIGTMTQYLAEAAGKVVAVEIDRNLLPILQETLADYDNVKVIHADVLSLDLEKLVQEENGGRPIKVVANLPYYITTPIIMALFEQHVPLANVTVMVQKEVAARMKSGPGSKDYGALSLAVQYYAVIRLTRYEEPPVQVKDEKMLFKIIRASFNQRRKTLQNGLNNSSELNFTKDQIAAAIAEAGFSPSVRGEALTLEQFAKLTDILLKA